MEKQNVKVTELEKDLVNALKAEQEKCIKLLKISENDTPQEIVKKIRVYVDNLLSENHTEENLREYAITLGSMWGEMIVNKYGWKWKYLDFGEDIKGIYIVSQNNFYCTPPLFVLTNILLGDNYGLDGNNDNTVLLTFNMLDDIEGKKPSKNYQVIT